MTLLCCDLCTDQASEPPDALPQSDQSDCYRDLRLGTPELREIAVEELRHKPPVRVPEKRGPAKGEAAHTRIPRREAEATPSLLRVLLFISSARRRSLGAATGNPVGLQTLKQPGGQSS